MVSQLAETSRAASSSSPPVTNHSDVERAESLNEIEAVSEVSPRAVLVLNAASMPTPIDLAPYGAYYRAAVRSLSSGLFSFDLCLPLLDTGIDIAVELNILSLLSTEACHVKKILCLTQLFPSLDLSDAFR